MKTKDGKIIFVNDYMMNMGFKDETGKKRKMNFAFEDLILFNEIMHILKSKDHHKTYRTNILTFEKDKWVTTDALVVRKG